MQIVYELPYIKNFGFVSVNEILSYTFFKEKPHNQAQMHFVMLVFEMGVFFLPSLNGLP